MYASIPVTSRVSLSWHNRLTVLLILSTTTSAANFTIVPQMSVVAAGATASFRCRHQTRNTFWLVNGTELVIGINIPPNITIGIINDSVNSLNIVGRLEYNGTLIQCGASNTIPREVTPNITFLVQGALSQVSNIVRTLSTISWIPPFSLDLTNIDPDIIYCVEVSNITCGRGSLLVSKCSVTESRLVDESLQSGYVYSITITPRSNVENALNGSSLAEKEMFTSLTDPNVVIMVATRSMVTAIFQFGNEGAGVEPALYSLNLTSIDETEKLALARNFTHDTSSTNLSISEFLPRRRLLNYQVLALNCSEHPVTSLLELSTHDLQNITVSSPSSGLVRVTGDFINGSSVTSMLVIVYSDGGNGVCYMISSPSTEGERVTTNISSLPSGPYKVSVFVLEENGVPFNRSAITPRSISVREHQEEENGNFFIEYEIQSTSTGVCITCTFLDSSATGCVAVVHQRISQLSSSGLMNIESCKFNRSGDTATGCIPIPSFNLEQYQVGVVGGRQIFSMQANEGRSQSALIAGSTSIVVSIVTVVVVVAILFIMRNKIRERRVIHIQEQEQQQPGDSSSLKPPTTPPGKGQDEEAYDVLRGPPKTLAPKLVEVDVGSTAIYSVLDNNPPQSVNQPQSDIFYTSVNLGPPSGTMGYDDLHKTVTQYSELQQEPQEEEESFNKGPGNIYAVTRIDTVTSGDVLSDFNDEMVYIFSSAQEYVVPSELTALIADTDDNDGT